MDWILKELDRDGVYLIAGQSGSEDEMKRKFKECEEFAKKHGGHFRLTGPNGEVESCNYSAENE